MNKTFKNGEKVFCKRANLFEVEQDKYKELAINVSMPVGIVIREVTAKSEKDFVEETGGIFEVEIKSLPVFEVLMMAKSRDNIQKIISQFTSADEMLKAAKNDPELFEIEYKIIPASNGEHVGKRVYIAGNRLKTLILN